MRTTTDTFTGKPFRWNDVVEVLQGGHLVRVPARMTTRTFTYLNPSRVPAELLATLNPAGAGHGAGEQAFELVDTVQRRIPNFPPDPPDTPHTDAQAAPDSLASYSLDAGKEEPMTTDPTTDPTNYVDGICLACDDGNCQSCYGNCRCPNCTVEGGQDFTDHDFVVGAVLAQIEDMPLPQRLRVLVECLNIVATGIRAGWDYTYHADISADIEYWVGDK
jgi:hypothetical protein